LDRRLRPEFHGRIFQTERFQQVGSDRFGVARGIFHGFTPRIGANSLAFARSIPAAFSADHPATPLLNTVVLLAALRADRCLNVACSRPILRAMARKPEPPKPATWNIYKFASKAV
jgi:hypothetical protein